MTEQYLQTNINVPMSGARFVDQTDVDASLTPAAVPLNADDEFVIASDDDDITDYQINLPDAREVNGKDITIAARITPVPIGVIVTIGTADGTGQTINGSAVPLPLGGAGNTIVLRANPPDNTVDPSTPSTGWTIIRGPSAP